MNLDGEYAIIANNEVFSTLRQNLKPKKIERQNIRVISYQQDPTDVHHLSATTTWKPSDDMCYFYELIWHSLTDTMELPKVIEVNDVSLPNIKLLFKSILPFRYGKITLST